jgi:hypothetical protein
VIGPSPPSHVGTLLFPATPDRFEIDLGAGCAPQAAGTVCAGTRNRTTDFQAYAIDVELLDANESVVHRQRVEVPITEPGGISSPWRVSSAVPGVTTIRTTELLERLIW